MKKVKQFFKCFLNLDKTNRCIMLTATVVIVLLVANMIVSIVHIKDYNKNRSSGNNRWFEVETRIKTYENKVDELEEFVETHENKLN